MTLDDSRCTPKSAYLGNRVVMDHEAESRDLSGKGAPGK